MGSELINRIKTDRITALKSKDEKTKGALVILLGEIDRNLGSKDLTDELALSVISKMCKNLEESISMVTKAGQDASGDQGKLEVISRYRPMIMDAVATTELVAQVRAGLPTEDQANIGKVMMALKPYASKIDMKLASALVRGG